MDAKKILSQTIEELLSRNGSDIHFGVSRIPIIRVDGSLVSLNMPALTAIIVENLLEIFLAKDKYTKFHDTQDIDFSFTHDSGVRMRGNAYIQKGNISIALRRIPAVVPLDTLSLPPSLKDFALAKQGFFLVVGPMGSGKSTTMSALVDVINTERSSHIVTIEDPVEFLFESKKSIIDQREVGTDTLSFESAMKSVFRADANVILIGEMRTRETMAAAVTAAETGHLVIATLHTNTAAQTIDRIIDSFDSTAQDQIRMQLASSLLGVLSQRLIPKKNGGRAVACELLVGNPAVSNLIREKRTHEIPVLIETGMEHGMIDMNRSLLDLIMRGEITTEAALEYSPNPESLKNRLYK
jgi:twitching motility protein PilT